MHLLMRILLSLMGQNKGSNDSFASKNSNLRNTCNVECPIRKCTIIFYALQVQIKNAPIWTLQAFSPNFNLQLQTCNYGIFKAMFKFSNKVTKTSGKLEDLHTKKNLVKRTKMWLHQLIISQKIFRYTCDNDWNRIWSLPRSEMAIWKMANCQRSKKGPRLRQFMRRQKRLHSLWPFWKSGKQIHMLSLWS